MGLFDFFRGKKKPDASEIRNSQQKADLDTNARAQSDKGHVTKHCFVLCGAAEAGDLSRAGEIVERILGAGFSATAEEAMVSVMRGEQPVGFLMHMPHPIPNQEAEHHADNNALWPNGKNEVATHRAHVVVANFSMEEQSPVQSALQVTRLALVALALYDGMGVYWGNASVCNSRKVFEGFCQNMSAQHLPVAVWLRFQGVRVSETELGFYTLGMSQFGLMEIEVDRSTRPAGALFEFVANIAHYLIDQGPVIADGNTVGGSESERIVVRHRPSNIEPGRKVYKIVFG